MSSNTTSALNKWQPIETLPNKIDGVLLIANFMWSDFRSYDECCQNIPPKMGWYLNWYLQADLLSISDKTFGVCINSLKNFYGGGGAYSIETKGPTHFCIIPMPALPNPPTEAP